MSFRKRNIALGTPPRPVGQPGTPRKEQTAISGTRPSAVDGRPVTSTGATSLDLLLGGHNGLALGSSLLIEESGTTDYAGALLKFYAAEGLLQGHHVYVIGLPDQWGRELPGLATESSKKSATDKVDEKMKIAWRYERLGQFGAVSNSRDQAAEASSKEEQSSQEVQSSTFCHAFDLSKRLVHPASAQLTFLPVDGHPSRSPFLGVISRLKSLISATDKDVGHRIVIPSLLSPAIYPEHACLPQHVLGFLHELKALLSTSPGQLTIVQSLPLSLFPRSSGLVRWIEILSDGVLELTPFPHSADAEFQLLRDPNTKEETPQGLLYLHKLPLLHERGIGNLSGEVTWTFTLSRRKFTIKPYNLPPIEGDTEAQQAVDASSTAAKKPNKADMDF